MVTRFQITSKSVLGKRPREAQCAGAPLKRGVRAAWKNNNNRKKGGLYSTAFFGLCTRLAWKKVNWHQIFSKMCLCGDSKTNTAHDCVAFNAFNACCGKKQCNAAIICIQYLYLAYSAFLIYAEKALAARTKQFAADPVCRPTWRAFWIAKIHRERPPKTPWSSRQSSRIIWRGAHAALLPTTNMIKRVTDVFAVASTVHEVSPSFKLPYLCLLPPRVSKKKASEQNVQVQMGRGHEINPDRICSLTAEGFAWEPVTVIPQKLWRQLEKQRPPTAAGAPLNTDGLLKAFRQGCMSSFRVEQNWATLKNFV